MKNRKCIISFVLSLVLILTANKFVDAYNDEYISKDTNKQIESQQIVNYNEKELNSTSKTTTNIGLNSIITGVTSSSYDYFKFTTTSDGYIDLKFNQNQDVRFNVYLLDINKNTIDYMNTGYGNSSETIREGLPKGTYYVRVAKYSSSNPDTRYSFSVKHTTTNTFEKEFNNSTDTANNINLNTTYSGITESSYYDYFKFTTNSDGYIDLKFNQNQNVRFNVYLLDINKNTIDYMNTAYGNSSETIREGLPKGTYYVRVAKYSNSNPDTQYSFNVKHTAINTFEKEFNNSTDTANNINLNTTYSGITESSYYDYFKFTTNSDGYIDLKFNQNQNVRFNVYLLDINKNTIDYMNTAYGNSSETIREGLPKGTYYVRVAKYSNSNPDTQYSFNVKHTATNTFEKEFNNSTDTANNINLNTTYSGITESSYYDYFKFTINSKQDIEIKISKNQNVRYNLELLDINRNILAKLSTQNGTGYDNLKQNLSNGTYYVRISKYTSSNEDTQYSFSVNNSTQNGWVKVSNKWYYYSNGEMATGWKLINGSWYYLNPSGEMATGWKLINGSWYYLNPSGEMATGWKLINGSWYYLNPSGEMATGWKLINGSWYYLNPSGEMATGWKLINGSWYYLNPSGEMATGWKLINGSWYYLNPSGEMATGWKLINGSWYYLKNSGEMQTGWLNLNGTWYYMYSSGKMATNTIIDGWKIGSNGVATPIK